MKFFPSGPLQLLSTNAVSRCFTCNLYVYRPSAVAPIILAPHSVSDTLADVGELCTMIATLQTVLVGTALLASGLPDFPPRSKNRHVCGESRRMLDLRAERVVTFTSATAGPESDAAVCSRV